MFRQDPGNDLEGPVDKPTMPPVLQEDNNMLGNAPVLSIVSMAILESPAAPQLPENYNQLSWRKNYNSIMKHAKM
jgi:hypothetical protein